MKKLYLIISLLAITIPAIAQHDTTIVIVEDVESKKKQSDKHYSISISHEGLKASQTDNKLTEEQKKELEIKKERKRWFYGVGMLDIGLNRFNDKTDYSTAAAQNFLNVPADRQNGNLFSLRDAKSVNVNIYPVMVGYKLINGSKQKLMLSTGLGLQMYNFRFNQPISYQNSPEPGVILDTLHMTKNKLGFTYLSLPVLLTSKTKLSKGLWLVYGAGVTGGFRLSSFTKQISTEKGKQKVHDQFNFQNFNLCVQGEIGIDNYFRVFASYQLTPLHKEALLQYPFSVGIRFLGI